MSSTPNGKLNGQIAWIGGAASGVGEATARLFAAEGAAVALIDIQGEQARRVAERIVADGGRAIAIECDVTREDAVRKSIERTVGEFGGLTILVNSAGVVLVKLLH